MRKYIVLHTGKKQQGDFYAPAEQSIVLGSSKEDAEKKTMIILGLNKSQGDYAVAYTMYEYGKLESSGFPQIN